jgi:hypothetical protein
MIESVALESDSGDVREREMAKAKKAKAEHSREKAGQSGGGSGFVRGEAGTEAIKPFANTLSLVMGVVVVRRGCHGASSRVLKEHRPVVGCAIEGMHAA